MLFMRTESFALQLIEHRTHLQHIPSWMTDISAMSKVSNLLHCMSGWLVDTTFNQQHNQDSVRTLL